MDGSASKLLIRAMGEWSVSENDTDIRISSKKTRALLTYLVFSPQKPHRRERLAHLLWPKVESKLAKASLRQTIFELNKALSNATRAIITVTKDTVSIDFSKFVTDFDELISRIENGQTLTSAHFDKNGISEFLHGFDDLGADFSDWIAQEQHSFSTTILTALKRALENGQADQDTLMSYATTLYRLDEFDEQAVRELMKIYIAKNEIPSALRIYTELYNNLDEQMDVEPSLETQSLAVSIKLMPPISEVAQTNNGPAIPNTKETPSTVAVLPFEILGVDGPDKFVLLGLLDDITCQLASLQSISVISSNSTRGYFGQTQSISEIRSTLGTKYVVVGSLRARSNRIAINVQVVETTTEQVLDARIHECGADDILNLHSSIAIGIANSIAPNLDRAELSRTQQYPVGDLEPYHLVIRAKEAIFDLSFEAFEHAGELISTALEKAPYFAPAHALHAEWRSIRIWQRWSNDPAKDNAILESSARRAISLSANEPRVMALLGHNRVLMHKRYDEASTLFQNALALLPNDSETLIWTVPSLTFMGQTSAAIANGEKSISLSPQDPFLFRNHHFLSIAHYAAGNFDRSAELGKLCYQDNPNYISNIRMSVAALNAAGRKSEIPELIDRHQSLIPDFSLKNYGDGPPFKDIETRNSLLADLRAGGLPT